MPEAVARPAATMPPAAPLPAAVTCFQNRRLATPRARVAGDFRIALVGDSMAYGFGLLTRESLAGRLAAHLNGALPSIWTDCVSLGVQGACLHNAVGRVVTQALPLDPDIVILCVCHNDAAVLAPACALDGLAAQWESSRGVMRSSLHQYRDTLDAAGRQGLVLYFDWFRQARGVCFPDELAAVCRDLNLPFIDGSATLAGYPDTDMRVSPDDGHVNAFGTDLMARQLAQFILGRMVTPRAGDFSDGAWLDHIDEVVEARIDAGVSPVFAYGEAIQLLAAKWQHRRNRDRSRWERHYSVRRQRLLDAHAEALVQLAAEVTGRALRSRYPFVWLIMAEQSANEVMALTYAVEHSLAHGSASPLPDITHLANAPRRRPAGEADAAALVPALATRIAHVARALAERVTRFASAGGAARHEGSELQFARLWSSRVEQWCRVAAVGAARCSQLLAAERPPERGDLQALTTGLLSRLRPMANALDAIAAICDHIEASLTAARHAAGAECLILELEFAADPSTIPAHQPGAATWAFSVGVDSLTPAYSEHHLGCGNLIRDGRPHRYAIDIPLMLAGHIQVRLSGPGLGDGALRRGPARLRWHGGTLPTIDLPAPTVTDSSDATVGLLYSDIRTLPLLS